MIFKTASHAFRTAIKGLSLTVKHLFGARRSRQELNIKNDNYFDRQEGIVTVQYPAEKCLSPKSLAINCK
ncbi:hypothetical protein KUH03_24055 [Sphingobacterium sp. E70]|uniref:hypothetical protein n=1 Tax=Sphingobacterium sp. E70 TaxID=2853439 RepID=UPI00211CD06E|nr:hypothetical protein [Sphingobacterium sp. E70]ULT22471.1 hypothetical protein KUH03_24055 [Sphingobacterium sp. E70]